jgi:hypothetical protein
MNEKLIRAVIIFGTGFGLFVILKKMQEKKIANGTTTKSADASTPAPDSKNAEIVASAYSEALKAGEPAARLTELNKEMTKEFGMRCYVSEDNKLVVCDVKGNTILTK